MKYLRSLTNAGDRVATTETNFEDLEAVALELNPTEVLGVPTALVGPPTSGDRLAGELWVDSLCAKWRCTVAGTPGTWQQIEPAFVATAARPVGAPDNYWIRDTDEHFTEYWWDDGGGVWTAI